MNVIYEALPIWLPLFLFFATLVIIFVLRNKDRNNRTLANAKKMAENLMAEIEKSDNAFKQDIADIQVKIGQQEDVLKERIQMVNSEIKAIDSYGNDLAQLRQRMAGYREALAGLANLTESAEQKVRDVENDVSRLEAVSRMVDEFRKDMAEAEAQLTRHENTVAQLEADTLEHLKSAASEADSDMDAVMASLKDETAGALAEFQLTTEKYINGHLERIDNTFTRVTSGIQMYFEDLDDKVRATREVTENLHASSVEILNNIGDRASDQVLLAQTISEMKEKRERLQNSLTSLEEQIEERATVSAEMEALSRAESEHLASVRREYERLEELRAQTERELAGMEKEAAVPEPAGPEADTGLAEAEPENLGIPDTEPDMTDLEYFPETEPENSGMPDFEPENTGAAFSESEEAESENTFYTEPKDEEDGTPFDDFDIQDMDLELPDDIILPSSETSSYKDTGAGEPEHKAETVKPAVQEVPVSNEKPAEEMPAPVKVEYTGEDEEIVFD